MSAQIDSKPTLIIPSNQKLIFTISESTGTMPDRFIVQVYEDSTEIAKLYLTPNTNDKVHFDLSDVAKDRVKVDDKIRDESATLLSYSTAGITTGRNGLKKYEVKVGSYTEASGESLNEDSDTVYLLDGVEQISAGLHPSFADYYPTVSTKKAWLTDRKAVSNVVNINARDEDEGCVAYLQDSTIISGVTTALNFNIYNASGTLLNTAAYSLTAIGAQGLTASDVNQKLTYLMAYPKNLNGWITATCKPSNNPTWDYYTLELRSSTASASNLLRFNKICGSAKNDNTQLAWTNSVGGWDSLTFSGRTEQEERITSKEYIKEIGNYDASTYTFLPEARESQPYQVVSNIDYKLTNLNFSFTELELLKYAFRSDNVMIRIGDSGGWMPVTLNTKNYKVHQTSSKMYSVTLSVKLAQTIKC